MAVGSTDLIVADSSFSGCRAQVGGAVYVQSGTVSLTRSTISDCTASVSGGGLHSVGGRTTLSDGTLISGCSAPEGRGCSVFPSAGEVSYTLPAPPGRWLPNARCEVFRERCPTDAQGRPINDCPNYRDKCALTLEVESEWACQAPTFVQPCNWNNETGGDPSLLGQRLYQLPLVPVEQDFPFACAAGLLGSADPEDQSSSSCAGPCPAGSQCPTEATSVALPCDAGRYCPEGTSVPLPCPGGTFSNATDLATLDECTACPLGHACTTASVEPTPCTPGGIASIAGMSACELCSTGHYATSSTTCEECKAGTYAAREGLSQCFPCPHPLGSASGSTTCAICKNGYYLQNSSASAEEIFLSPTDYCKPCPLKAECDAPNTTLESIGVPRGHWRASNLSVEIHGCVASDHCSGSSRVERSTRQSGYSAPSGGAAGQGCDAGHTGPLCAWCVSESHYFDRAKRGCAICPSASERLGIFAGAIVAAIGAALLLRLALTRIKACGRCNDLVRCVDVLMRRFDVLVSRVGIQPKFKIVASFFQIAATIDPVYGVRLHEDYTRWTDFIHETFQFDFLGLTYPDACLGSMEERLLLGALWPFVVILLGAAAFACRAASAWLLSGRSDTLRRDLVRAKWRSLYWAILVMYLVLPSVSRSTFKAKQCESYNVSVFTGERRSYLVADLDELCSAEKEHRGLDAIFWSLLVLWLVIIPSTLLALLLWIRRAVRAQRKTPLATACRFLWRDYDPDFCYWEVCRSMVLPEPCTPFLLWQHTCTRCSTWRANSLSHRSCYLLTLFSVRARWNASSSLPSSLPSTSPQLPSPGHSSAPTTSTSRASPTCCSRAASC